MMYVAVMGILKQSLIFYNNIEIYLYVLWYKVGFKKCIYILCIKTFWRIQLKLFIWVLLYTTVRNRSDIFLFSKCITTINIITIPILHFCNRSYIHITHAFIYDDSGFSYIHILETYRRPSSCCNVTDILYYYMYVRARGDIRVKAPSARCLEQY